MTSCSPAGVLVLSWYPPGLAEGDGEPAEDVVPAVLDAAHRRHLKVIQASTSPVTWTHLSQKIFDIELLTRTHLVRALHVGHSDDSPFQFYRLLLFFIYIYFLKVSFSHIVNPSVCSAH